VCFAYIFLKNGKSNGKKSRIMCEEDERDAVWRYCRSEDQRLGVWCTAERLRRGVLRGMGWRIYSSGDIAWLWFASGVLL